MKLRPLTLAVLVLALDAAWAWQAFHATPVNAGSNVALVSLVVWSFVHLPAAIVGGWIVRPFGALDHGAELLPAWALVVMAVLGLLQAFGMTFGLATWWQRRRSQAA